MKVISRQTLIPVLSTSIVDGAWRALGPNIENEFDTLDERYVKLHNEWWLDLKNSRNLTFKKADDSDQFAINPNVNSDYFTNIYTFNNRKRWCSLSCISRPKGVGSSIDTHSLSETTNWCSI